jgi:hypothetical protein
MTGPRDRKTSCFSIEQIGDAAPEALPVTDRPLAGIKVLDLTRIIAGPVLRKGRFIHRGRSNAGSAVGLPAGRP